MDDDWDDNPVVSSPEYTNWRANGAEDNSRHSRDGNINQKFNTRNYYGKSNNWSNDRNQRQTNNFREQWETVNMEIPSKYVGRVIGKGGSMITELQIITKAKINITKEVVGDNTIVKITGGKEPIEKAQTRIKELITEKQPVAQPVFEKKPINEEPKIPLFDDWQAMSEACDRATKEMWAKAPPIKKEFYIEDPFIANMSAKDVEMFREANNNIVVSRVFEKEGNKPIPNPVQTFEQAFRHYPLILNEIKNAGFTQPSPIQTQAWPIILNGEDLIGIAQTGTGKTLAFLLPALIHIDGQPVPRHEREGPSVLVFAPTRELAQQIDREIKKYNYKDIKTICIYGGADKQEQINALANGVDIVVATPGRLNDLYQGGYLSVKSVSYVVLDEADRMLDMGFEPQIRKVLYNIRPNRQTVMTSATWPSAVRRLADSYMDNPVQVHVGSLDLAAVHSVTQTIVILPDNEEEKFSTFMEFVRGLQPDEKVIVFCGKKTRADYLSSELVMEGIDCQAIHGDRQQEDREQALADITDGTVQILIATDVASRGLDIEDITHVVNYDFPRNIEEYVHRVGRTGRAGRTGHSISYFTRTDWGNAKELISILEEADQYVPEELFKMSERFEARQERNRASGGRGNRFDGNGGRFSGGGGRFSGGGRRW